MQYAENSVAGLCSNTYCKKGKDGKRAPVAIRNVRTPSYCSQACNQMMSRYKDRYKGTNAGPLSKKTVEDKMNTL